MSDYWVPPPRRLFFGAELKCNFKRKIPYLQLQGKVAIIKKKTLPWSTPVAHCVHTATTAASANLKVGRFVDVGFLGYGKAVEGGEHIAEKETEMA